MMAEATLVQIDDVDIFKLNESDRDHETATNLTKNPFAHREVLKPHHGVRFGLIAHREVLKPRLLTGTWHAEKSCCLCIEEITKYLLY